MFDTRTSIVLPIQESFDIARGRNSIRTLISLRHWPMTFVANSTGDQRVAPDRRTAQLHCWRESARY